MRKWFKQVLIVLTVLVIAFALFGEKMTGPPTSQNGVSVYGYVGNIFSKYDQDKDQRLSVSEESFLRITTSGITKTESYGLLFTDADNAGNKDGYVIHMELEEFLGQFDTDGDGELTTFKNIFHSIFSGASEWKKFDDKYGEKYKYREE